ncbi:hypothetical protein PoB_000628000 [Plakobranchus ocellatus]|uniref:Uncharacterized protein n=1 Tax=Plakobranchus ocellatus TaxID=259542 RepID=A0AAV3Y9J4_9GAST|nr:hypothetical protein PoB_000628000 [Plakobranchus ocellatus]
MDEYERLIQAEKAFNLEGQKLLDWVEKARALEREEAREREEKAREREERAADREFKKLELEVQQAQATPPEKGFSTSAAHKIKLPPFDDRNDDIDAYIFRFEVLATR